jgi:preprotein translocase subunit YajC
MSGLLLPLYIIVFVGLFYMLAVRPQKRRRQELESLLARLAPGDEVVTVSGIYGTVTEVEEGETILLEVAEDTDIRIAKASIARVLGDRTADAQAPADAAEA